VLAFVHAQGEVHPRDVEARFAHGAVVNAWGGISSATTHLLDAMHYRGWLRVARREGGIRRYAVPVVGDPLADASTRARLDALVDVAVRAYAPLPAGSLAPLLRRLRYGAPQLRRGLDAALVRARTRLAHERVDGLEWYWPADERPELIAEALDDDVRLLAPFDPIVWDRTRFERLWGWAYRFEAYTPVARRKLGYYALPLLFGDAVIGWANVGMNGKALTTQFGYVSDRAPRSRGFRARLEREVEGMRTFARVSEGVEPQPDASP
jgi:uncharacterized protein YcaQ